MVRNLEKKTLDELKDLHVDTVDEDEDEAIVVGGKHTFSWKVNNTAFFFLNLSLRLRNPAVCHVVHRKVRSISFPHRFCPIGGCMHML